MQSIVLGFIHDKSNKRVGIRVFNLTDKQVSDIHIPKKADYMNLNIGAGGYDAKHCYILDFPEYKMLGDTLDAGISRARGAGAWVVGEYSDGRLLLVSTEGQLKTVTNATAVGYAKQFKIVNASVTDAGLVAKRGTGFIRISPDGILKEPAQAVTAPVPERKPMVVASEELKQEVRTKLHKILAEVASHFSSLQLNPDEIDEDIGNYFGYLTVHLRSERYGRMSHLAATDDIVGSTVYWEEKLQEKYGIPSLSVSGEIGDKGYYSLTVGMNVAE